MSVQAIAGVSASSEAKIMTVFPSISAGIVGRLLGQILGSMPISIFGPYLSTLLFGLPLAPIAALLYVTSKATGSRYVLTNRSVQVWSALGDRRYASVDLADIDRIETQQQSGQAFYRAADLKLVSASGQTLLRLPGVGDSGSFRNAIERTADARRLVASAARTIAARKI